MTHSHSRPGLAQRDVPALSTCNSSHFRYVSVRLLCIQAHQDCAVASSKPTRSKTRSVLRVARACGSQGTRNSRFLTGVTQIPRVVCASEKEKKRDTLSSRQEFRQNIQKEYTSSNTKSIRNFGKQSRVVRSVHASKQLKLIIVNNKNYQITLLQIAVLALSNGKFV